MGEGADSDCLFIDDFSKNSFRIYTLGVSATGEGDSPNPTNVEEGLFNPTTQRSKNTSPDSLSGESESSSNSNESSSDSNESAEELPPVPVKPVEVRNATRRFQRH